MDNMKNLKGLVALVVAMMMTLSLVSVAFAADPALPKANITISNLEDGDTVNLYKIIKWDTTASDWAFDGITVDGYTTVDALVAALQGSDAPAVMTKLAAAVASKAKENSGNPTSGTYTYEAEVGSYLALISTSSANVYNPMVLSVNFTNPTTGAGSTIDASTAVTGTSALAKKQPVTLTKEVDTAATGYSDPTSPADVKKGVAVGDTIPFKVSTVTPNYGTNYTSPTFTITDTLSTGLTMTTAQQNAIVVKNNGTTLTAGADKDYTITTSESGYTITFTTDYLTTVKSNTNVTVEYTATVNAKAVMHQVERYTNDVQLVFSNSPTTTNDSLKDKTNHYTFSIDSYLTGQNGGEGSTITKELIKVGIDDGGNVLTEWVTTDTDSWTWRDGVHALQGAEFTLTRSDGKTYTATSDANGYIKFTGLDAATYSLAETSAPAGYKFDTTAIPVVISASYYGDGVTGHDADELKEYSITINGTATSTYSVTNDGTYVITDTVEKTANTNETFPINNVKGVTLPSTGGIGTTIFYIVGVVMVLGAAAIMVARRKSEQE